MTYVNDKELERLYSESIPDYELRKKKFLSSTPSFHSTFLTSSAYAKNSIKFGSDGINNDNLNRLYEHNFISEAITSSSRYLNLYSIKPTYSYRKTFFGHKGLVYCIEVDYLNKQFYSSSHDSTICVWKFGDDEAKEIAVGHFGGVRALKIAKNYNILFSGADDKMIKCWNMDNMVPTQTYYGHASSIVDLAYDEVNSLLFSGSSDCSVRIWDVRSQHSINKLENHGQSIARVGICHDSIISTSFDRSVHITDRRRLDKVKAIIAHDGTPKGLAIHPYGFEFVTGSKDGLVFWDLEGNVLHRVKLTTNFVNTLDVDPQGIIVSGGSDGVIEFIDWANASYQTANTMIEKEAIEGEESINCARYDRTFNCCLFAQSDKTIRMWTKNQESR
eukprot:TRINITY_DN3155_c0_g1_i1.p1 TRINITY_DN3155_c0_g1~~TRINITY_DN3155_c0_g1_i1.p1  ORF type:complete len:389 (-),score=89.22 TRINITY_DN3155_c0_g1_i1:131-1297(-)